MITQVMQEYQRILEEEVKEIARQTGAVKRERKLDAATFVQSLIFGFWQDPDLRISGLAQIAGRREVVVSEAAISQRFHAASAALLLEVLKRLVAVRLESEPVEIPLLRQFAAVIVEDSSILTLPDELAEVWRGCGGSEAASRAALKLFVRWNVLSGELFGPLLTDGSTNDHRSPFEEEGLVEGCLYLADLGFFAIAALRALARGRQGRRFFVTRLQANTTLYTRGGHRLELEGILPQEVGQVREMGVLLGKHDPLAVRLILVKVPPEVAEQRRQRLRRQAQKQGRLASEESLALAQWTILISNLPRKRATASQIIVLLRLRWQIERLFRLWKEDGKIDAWRSKKPQRILCDLYAKLAAMVMQQACIQEGCWLDPHRSIVKAAAVLRRECNRLMMAFSQGNLESTITSLLRPLRSGCRIERRGASPSTSQLLLSGLDWPLDFA